MYVLSDFSVKTLEYYESAAHLRPFVERGLLDFAVFDAASGSELKLQRRFAATRADAALAPLRADRRSWADRLW